MPTRCWRCSSVKVGARRSTGRGSVRWFLFPTNTWEPPPLTWVVWVSARTNEPCASFGVRMEKCNSNKGTGGMECSVVLFKPRIHLFACTHLSVSNMLDVMPCLCTYISLQPFVQTRLNCGSLLYMCFKTV